MIWWLILAGMGGWTGDDWCPTPPRPPWPWPWWLRKVVAVLGGIGCFYLIGPRLGAPVDVVSAVLLGAVGGVVLTGLAGLAGGGRAGPSA